MGRDRISKYILWYIRTRKLIELERDTRMHEGSNRPICILFRERGREEDRIMFGEGNKLSTYCMKLEVLTAIIM
jgi:hypothetical protein